MDTFLFVLCSSDGDSVGDSIGDDSRDMSEGVWSSFQLDGHIIVTNRKIQSLFSLDVKISSTYVGAADAQRLLKLSSFPAHCLKKVSYIWILKCKYGLQVQTEDNNDVLV